MHGTIKILVAKERNPRRASSRKISRPGHMLIGIFCELHSMPKQNNCRAREGSVKSCCLLLSQADEAFAVRLWR